MRLSILTLLLPALAISCASKSTTPDTVVRGELALSSYPSTPQSVVATNAGGAEVRGTVGATGAFQLPLPHGTTYGLSVELDGRRIPIAMARRSGNFDRTFRVSSKGVVVSLGTTHYVAGGAKPALVIVAAAAACPAGASCVEDTEQSSCGDGQQGHDDGNNADGECENGIDAKTHAACTDPSGDAAEQADRQQEMALPSTSAPADASGCDGDGEEAD